MRNAVAVLALAVAAAVATAGAGADGGGPTPGMQDGWDGARAEGAPVRYVALPARTTTTIAVIRVGDGRVLRWTSIRGGYGVPTVAYDGTTGGLSADRRTLVLSSFDTRRFAVLSTRTLRLRNTIVLPGIWSYDALSPDAATLFLVEYLSIGQNPPYRVRAYDVEAGRLIPGAIVDRREGEAEMRGQPATRTTSPDGRWAYTLYARQNGEPFVHALDTVRREAFCIDLPLRLSQPKQMELRLKLTDRGESLSVRQGRTSLAAIDTRSFGVRRS